MIAAPETKRYQILMAANEFNGWTKSAHIPRGTMAPQS